MSDAVKSYMQGLDPAVRNDIAGLYRNAKSPSSGLLTKQMLDRANDLAHAEAVSQALQDMEQIVGDEGKFGVLSIIDYVQQEYDAAVYRNNDAYRGADRDLRQDYGSNANVAAARRAAAHDPSATSFSARADQMLRASAFMQAKELEEAGNGRPDAVREIDDLQEEYERVTALDRHGLSSDIDGPGAALADWAQLLQQTMQLFRWLFPQ